MFKKLLKAVFRGEDKRKADNRVPFDIEGLEEKMFIQYEAAYRYQKIKFRRSTEKDKLVLGELLEAILQKDVSCVKSMAIAYRTWKDNTTEERVIGNAEEVWNFDLFSCIQKDKVEGGHYALGMSHETTIIVKTTDCNLIFSLTSLGGSLAEKYMRVSLLIPDNSDKDDGKSFNGYNTPFVRSFILAHSELENDPSFQTFEAVEQSANMTHLKGRKMSELEDSYMYGKYEFHFSYYIGYGEWLFSEQRYYDAYSTLERGYNYMKRQLDYLNENYKAAFYDVCNTLGMCLSKLGREEEASYFFLQGAPGLTHEQPNWLALSHAKLGNPMAMVEIAEWLKPIAQKYGDYDNLSLATFCTKN